MCDSGWPHADRVLTLDLRRYLLEAGLTPLIDAKLGGRHLDGEHPTASPSFYAEAKQYTTANPGALIRRTYSQLWGTWRRLRRLYHCNEALLIIFRRNGRLVEVPPVIDVDGLRLHSLLVDISQASSSNQPASVVRFNESRLRPSTADYSVVHEATRVRRRPPPNTHAGRRRR